METKYLQNGYEVVVERKLQEGFLIRRIYDYDSDDGQLGDIEFVETVFDKPPTERIAESITELERKRKALVDEVRTLTKQRNDEVSLLSKVASIDELQTVVDFLNGNYSVMLCHDCSILKKDYLSQYKVVHIVYSEGRVDIDIYKGTYGNPIRLIGIYQSFSEAQLAQKERLIQDIKKHVYGHTLRTLLDGDHIAPLLNDPMIKTAVDEQKEIIAQTEKRDYIEAAIKDYKEIRDRLNKLDIDISSIDTGKDG